jgi:predicted site-specific integrase-resolvase
MTIKDAQRKFISIGEAAVFTGLSQETLRRYFTKGQVSGFTSAGGQRRFEVENLKSLCARNLQTSSDNENGIEKRQVKRKDIIYARVSSKKQADDLERQIQFIKQEIINSGKNPDDFELISDIGSGVNFNKKGTNVLLDYAMSGTVGNVIIANKDRLSRFGFDLFKAVIIKGGGKLTVLNNIETRSSEQELAEDLLSIVHIFSCRQMGKRSYKNRKCIDKDSEIQNLPKSNTEVTI